MMRGVVAVIWLGMLAIGLSHGDVASAQAGGSEGGSIGGAIAPAAPAPRRHLPHPRPAPTRVAVPRPGCDLRLVPTQNPDGSACAIVVGFSNGVRVGPYHTGAGEHLGTCEGFLRVKYLHGDKVGFDDHMRTLSEDCRSSTGY